MKKDTTIAVFTGFILGLFVAFLIVNLPTLTKKGFSLKFELPKFSFNRQNQKISPSPSLSPQKLEISSPTPNSISSTSKISLIGKGKAASTIVVNSNLEDKVTTISDDGTFKVDLNLSEGANNILVTAYINSSTYDSQNLIVSYTPEKL